MKQSPSEEIEKLALKALSEIHKHTTLCINEAEEHIFICGFNNGYKERVESPSEEEMSDSGKLIKLADWFDVKDKEIWGKSRSDEVQQDLRRIAAKILELDEQVELSLNAARLFESKLKEKSDQEALSKAWEEGMKEGDRYAHDGGSKPKNPYTKD